LTLQFSFVCWLCSHREDITVAFPTTTLCHAFQLALPSVQNLNPCPSLLKAPLTKSISAHNPIHHLQFSQFHHLHREQAFNSTHLLHCQNHNQAKSWQLSPPQITTPKP
jgi:hypothetical protein